jgi:WD40 repeat protein
VFASWGCPRYCQRRALWSVAFSPDGGLLATIGNEVKIWDTRSGRTLQTFEPGGMHVQFTREGDRVLTNWLNAVVSWPTDGDIVH